LIYLAAVPVAAGHGLFPFPKPPSLSQWGAEPAMVRCETQILQSAAIFWTKKAKVGNAILLGDYRPK
jgi:hypothetical protein